MPLRKKTVRKYDEEKTIYSSRNEKSENRKHRHVDEYSEVMRAEKPSSSSYQAYIPKPRKISFDIQAQNEHIILLLRQHPLTQVKWVLIALIMLVLPVFFMFSNIFDFLPLAFKLGGFMGWMLLVIGFSLESFLKWFYHVFIITDERIIDLDFISMVHKDVSITKIDRIEDITYLKIGFIASLFDFGTVLIQTAATQQQIQFENVPRPSRVTSLLNELILEEELEKLEGRVN
jgi:hypothetical protein